MAQVEPRTLRSPPMHIPIPTSILSPPRTFSSINGPSSHASGHLTLDTLSPVNKHGSFEFDRVIKSGKIHRRIKKKGAWKPSWKPAFLVLRPNLLSIYRSEDESGLSASVTLSDVTAVAPVKKTHTENVFGVFTPSKNYHFQGLSPRDTNDWIERVGNEARVDTLDEVDLASPSPPRNRRENPSYDTTDEFSGDDRVGGSEPLDTTHRALQGQTGQSRASMNQRRTSHLNEYSGNEMTTSHSDFSDAPGGSLPKSKGSVPLTSILSPVTNQPNNRPAVARNASQLSGFDMSADPERVVRQDWLLVLKTKGGVKQWKKLWVVLRPKNLSFYKNEQEYSAVNVFSMSSVIDAAEIDPVSKSKRFCMQIILEDKAYRCCALDDDALAKWLGALKSVLAKKKEGRKLTDATAALSVR